jgi:H+/Cl- antiporter ClcA
VSSHRKAPKAHGGFDDSDDGFDRLLSQSIESPACGRGGAVFHSRGEVGFERGRFGFGMLLELPNGAAVGLAALFAAAANTPLALSIMAVELCGAAVLPHVAIVAVVAYLLSGRTSIYPAQRLIPSEAAAHPE